MLKSVWLALGLSKTSKDKAAAILNDVPQEKAFWTNDGRILKNLQDLSKTLNDISDDVFTHHVNQEKNDFSNWIKDAVGDEELAVEISKIKSKEKILKKVNMRNDHLKKLVGEKF